MLPMLYDTSLNLEVSHSFHCLFCHGYEERGPESAGVLAIGDVGSVPPALHLARSAKQLAKKVTIYTDGAQELADSLMGGLHASDKGAIVTDTRPIARLVKDKEATAVSVHFSSGPPAREGFLVHRPNPWNHRTRYWSESRFNRALRKKKTHGYHDLLGYSIPGTNSTSPSWRNIIKQSDLPWIQDHVVQSNIVYPGAGLIAMAVEAAFQSCSPGNLHISAYPRGIYSSSKPCLSQLIRRQSKSKLSYVSAPTVQ